jgi:hypothetical protein
MADMYKGSIPIIDFDSGHTDLSHPKEATFGCVQRDYNVEPETVRAAPSGLKVYDETEWDALFDEQERLQSSLEHIYLSGPNGTPAFVNLDQKVDGHCWSYSTGHAIMLDRLKRNLSPVRLNPHGVAAMLGRFDGGWCGLSGQFARENGYPVEGTGPGEWPANSNNRANDTAAVRAQMTKKQN